MDRWTPLAILALLCLFLGQGCQKQATTEVAAPSYQQLPEATNVLAALTQKSYEEAVAALVKLKENVATEQQVTEYSMLTREVKDKLLDASLTDPKAQEALQAFRVMTTGR